MRRSDDTQAIWCDASDVPDVRQLMDLPRPAFAVLERARRFMEENGQPFDVALAVTRAGNLFTTHTPVAAGFDRFSPARSSNISAGTPRS